MRYRSGVDIDPGEWDLAPLRVVIGDGVRRVRRAAGARQEDVARIARRYGLTWSRGRIWDLERGEKAISAEELVLLPLVLSDVAGRPINLADLIEDVEAMVDVTRETSLSTDAVRAILSSTVAEIDFEYVIPKPLFLYAGPTGSLAPSSGPATMWRQTQARDRLAAIAPHLDADERASYSPSPPATHPARLTGKLRHGSVRTRR